MRGRRVFFMIALLVVWGVPWLSVGKVQGQTGACEALVSRALSDLGTNCARLGANSVCFGYPSVTATAIGTADEPVEDFAEAGDLADLAAIGSLSTGLFSTADSEWGIAVISAQLNGHSAATKKATTFLMMGEAQISNLAAPAKSTGPKKAAPVPMESFTLHTGADSTECMRVPPSSLVVQSPSDMLVTITVNGIPLQLGSTVILRAPATDQMQIITGNGKAVVFPNSPSRVEIPAGVSVNTRVGDNEIEYTAWRVMSQDEWDQFEDLEDVPANVLAAGYANPAIIQASGVGRPQPQVQLPSGITRPTPPTGRPFPLIAMHTGRPGRDLDAPDWTRIALGEGTCTNEVFFHSNRTNDWDVFMLDLASAATVNLTQSPGSADIEPSIAPDCGWFTFVSNRDPQGSWEIYVSNIDGSQVQRLTYNTGIDVNPVWGPGGSIVFESNRDRNWELYMAYVTGDGDPVRLTNNDANDMGAVWLPDGEHIIFESDRDGDWELFKLNILTSKLTQLTDNETVDRLATVSHDGNQVAWLQADEDGVENIWLMNADGSAQQQMTDTGYSAGSLTFAADDSFLVFHAQDVGGDSEIFALDLATGTIKTLTINSVDDRAPTVWGDPSRVIYQSAVDDRQGRPGQYDLFIVDPLPLNGPANAPVRLTVEPEADDIFALAEPRDESNTRPNLILDVLPR